LSGARDDRSGEHRGPAAHDAASAPSSPARAGARSSTSPATAGVAPALAAPHDPLTRVVARPWWLAGSLLVLLAVVAVCARDALAWVGRPFAGLLFADNLIVVSIGSASWRDPQLRRTEWSRIIALDGASVHSARDVLRAVAARAPGHRITYALSRDDETFRIAIPVRTFTWTDFRDVFAPMLAVGSFLALSGGGLMWLRPDLPQVRALYALCAALGLLLVTGPDQYGPYRFTPLYLMAVALVPPAIVHLAAAYPWQPRAWAWRAVAASYLLFATAGLALIVVRDDARAFLALLYFVYLSLANAVLLYAGSLFGALVTRRRSRLQLAVALAAVVGSSLLGALVLIVYPLMTDPIAPAWLVLPLVLMPILSGIAFVVLPDAPAAAEVVA
jgi:hypothetical protein